MIEGLSRERAEGVSRVVLFDKPEGWTSFDVVRRSKRCYRGKIGHAGTLDPFATGLLIGLFGQATRLSSLFMDLPKEYRVSVQFGAVSTTADRDGEITPSGGATEVVETPRRTVMVYDLTVLGFDGETQVLDLLAQVGRGTYIRTLAEDLGRAVGAGAFAASLRRLRVGRFDALDAMRPEELEPEALLRPDGRTVLSLSAALAHLPEYQATPEEAYRVSNGNDLMGGPAGLFRVCSSAGLLALYEGRREGPARPHVVFPAPED